MGKHSSNVGDSTSTLLVYKGHMLKAFMRKERIDEDEIYAIVREKGLSTLEEAAAVVLETDGTLTVVKEIPDMTTAVMMHIETPGTVKEQ